jgi:hypothetical protein
MPITDNKIRNLAELALAITGNDIVRAVDVLREWTGAPFETALSAVDDIVEAYLDEIRPPARGKPAEDSDPL